jgi:crossover junction endodeoxyribonuclease RuvC
MLVLGVDPGTRYLGWGLVRRAGTKLSQAGYGVIAPDPKQQLADRLVIIEQQLVEVIAKYRPDSAAVESLFFSKDAQAAAKLGHARGVVLLVLARQNVELFEYAPARVKRMIAGKGNAEKRQVALMIKAMLGLSELPRADATDALALAVTHLRLGQLAKPSQSSLRGSHVGVGSAEGPRERLLRLARAARKR